MRTAQLFSTATPQLAAGDTLAVKALRSALLVASGTLVLALASRVALPLSFTPVPLSLQPLAVLGVGLALGPVLGFATVVAYLLEGAAGLPVLSPTGPGGMLQLLGPTGGYLLADPIVAAIAGGLTRSLRPRLPAFPAAAVACTVAVTVLFLCGAAWMVAELHLTLHAVWIAAVLPFLPGEAVKIVVAAGIYQTLARQRYN